MPARRRLMIVADDYGIGPGTSQGILELAQLGLISGAVLLVNSPFAEQSVQAWRAAGEPMDLGWHPCLTIDHPVLAHERVPSLVEVNGQFPTLGAWMRRLAMGRIKAPEVALELRAQYDRFVQLVGRPPRFVNAHHHLHVFPIVGPILRQILGDQAPLPYLRCIQEPARTLRTIRGGRVKRLFLNSLGRFQARRQLADGFPGNDWLAGLADAADAQNPDYFLHWLRLMPGQDVELMCDPGHLDPTLLGRDGSETDCLLQRRTWEWRLLQDPAFLATCREAGFTLISPESMVSGFARKAG